MDCQYTNNTALNHHINQLSLGDSPQKDFDLKRLRKKSLRKSRGPASLQWHRNAISGSTIYVYRFQFPQCFNIFTQ
jgi:hypothetical protein